MTPTPVPRPGLTGRPALLAVVAVVALVVGVAPSVGAQDEVELQNVPDAVTLTPDVVYAEVDGFPLTVDVYAPADRSVRDAPAVVLVHGGGWATGSPKDLADEGILFARQGWVAFAIGYRLTEQLGNGGVAWPTELSDVQRGVRWVGANAATYGADPAHLALFGVSAGGHLAAMVGAVGTEQGSAPAGIGDAPADPPDGDPAVDVDVVAVWSAPTMLAELTAPPGSVPPGCGNNTRCSQFWSGTWGTDLLGCTPEECPDVYRDASPAEVWPAGAPDLYVANARSEIIPLGQPEALVDRANEKGTPTRLDIVGGAGHADYASTVWNEMVPFMAAGMGVAVPEPIDFASTREQVARAIVLGFAAVLVVALVVALARALAEERRRRPDHDDPAGAGRFADPGSARRG